MRKILNAVIVIPLALVLLAFAVANRQIVTVSFDPFSSSDPSVALRLPLFAVIIAVAILGVFAGGFATWWRQGGWRRRARDLDAQARRLRAEIDSLKSPPAGGAGQGHPIPPLPPYGA